MSRLKIKQTNNQEFSSQLAKGSDRVTRVVPIADDVFKKLKMKAIMDDTTLYELLNNRLIQILKENPSIKPVNIKNAKKRPFSVDKELFKQVKVFCVQNELKIQDILINALNAI